MSYIRSRSILAAIFIAFGLSKASAEKWGRQAEAPWSGLVAPRSPELPIRAASGGEVILEVAVAPDGNVGPIRVLRTTPPFTEAVLDAVERWRFEPFPESEEHSSELLLVAAVFRAPSFYSATTAGTPPVDVDSSSAVSFPTRMVAPAYPANASGDGVVIAEIGIGARGEVLRTDIRTGGPPFDAAALDALRGWRFRAMPDTPRSRPSAIVIFGFREPVVTP